MNRKNATTLLSMFASLIVYCLLFNSNTATAVSKGTHNSLYFTLNSNTQVLHLAITYEAIDTNPPSISILSPENTTYPVAPINAVPLTFTVNESTSWVGYSLDGQMNVTITGNTTIFSLSEETHTITVYANDTAGNMGYSDTIYFALQTSALDITPPTISILSPQNKTYAATDVLLTFTVDESVTWIGYSTDGKGNVTITGNTTLLGLTDGSHNLIVYARDTAGNLGASGIVYFAVETKQEPFPTLIIAAIVIIVVLGTAVYLLKNRKKS